MSDLNSIVNVTITAATASASRAGFGTGAIVSDHGFFTERMKTYTSMTSVAEDIPTTSVIYDAANEYFNQNPRPLTLKIGRVQVDEFEFTVASVANDTDYTVTLNGTDYTYTSTGAATDDLITAGLVALLDAVDDFSATDGGDGTFTLETDTTGTAFTIGVNSSTLLTYATETIGDASWTAALNAINTYDSDWYRFGATDRLQATQLLCAAWAQSASPPREYWSADDDTVIVNTAAASDTTSLPALAKAAGYDRTTVIYSSKADGTTSDEWPEFGLMGYAGTINLDTETITYRYRKVAGVTAESLTPTQITNLQAKFCNYFETIAGNNVFNTGASSEGEWIDIIEGLDWLKARIQEDIFNLLLNNKKVPYTDGGIQAIVGAVRSRLVTAIKTGLLAFDSDLDKTFGVVVTGPSAADVSAATKATRVLGDVTFKATFAGAIHAVTLTGTVSA